MRTFPVTLVFLWAATGCQSPLAPPPEAARMQAESTNAPARAMAAPATTAPPASAPSAASRHTAAAALITPGQSVSGTELGESYEDVAARLGRPDASDAAMGKMMAVWYAGHNPDGHQTALFFSRDMGQDETSRVRQIRVTSPFFKTAAGLGVGSAATALRAAYRLRPVSAFEEGGRRYQTLAADGILFEVGPDDRCSGVIVTARGAETPPYLPFHPDARLLD